MKNILAILMIMPAWIPASQAKEMKAYSYKAEGRAYYRVYNAVPNSAMAYYTTHGGGRRICTQAVDASGNSLYAADPKDRTEPAMVINTTDPATQVKGNSNVIQLYGTHEFAISDIQLKENALTWNASVISTDAYVFEIWASADGKDYQKAATIHPVSGRLSSYTFPLTEENRTMHYQLKVTGVKNELSWASRIMDAAPANTANVYPSIFTNEIHIDLKAADEENSYTLETMTGEVIQTGKLAGTENRIVPDHLASGMYLLKTKANHQVSVTKLVKR